MLHVHRSARADGLLSMLGDLLADPLEDPLAAEVIAVPTRGVERWLTQQLCTRLGAAPGRSDGICGNVTFPFPGTLVNEVLGQLSETGPQLDPWSPRRSVWPLLEVVDGARDQPWLAPLWTHLRNASPDGEVRRFADVWHIADLFDRYGVHRPDMIRRWREGDDGGVPAEARWQAALWRALAERLQVPSPAERLAGAVERLAHDPGAVELPRRVSLFGLTRLPPSYLEVLGALAHGRDVHLFLLHPSPVLWDAVAARLAGREVPRSRATDPTVELVHNSLLESWGRDCREMQVVLAGLAAGTGRRDHHLPAPDGPDTLLGWLQQGVRRDSSERGYRFAPGDRSVQVHACHGRGRQVEVLRDAICQLLADDPTLEPRDIVVMCPDIDSYAPMLQAVFGGGRDAEVEDGYPDLPVLLADRSIRQTNPVLGALSELLSLVGSRVTASRLLDFLGRPPVRRRFGFDDDELGRVQEWVVDAGIRWGLDGDHRAPFGLTGLEVNSWRWGLDRLMAGVAVAEVGERRVGEVLPLDDVSSGDIDLAGRLVDVAARVADALQAFEGPRTVTEWLEALGAAADSLFDVAERDAWQLAQLRRVLGEVAEESGADRGEGTAVLTAADVRALLKDRLRGQPTRANFRTGNLTICTMVPMRSVPHRVVCLLGLSDGAFPRQVEHDGDDVMAASPRLGDRDASGEDRQLLLDALMAATDHLVVVYEGADVRTNLRRPPAVPLAELLTVIDQTVEPAEGTDGRISEQVVRRHPLQPFDPRNFADETPPDRPGPDPWSFDVVNLNGAKSLRAERQPPPPFLAGPLPEMEEEVIELDQLEYFVRHPVRAFLRRRLGLYLRDFSVDVEDAIPLALDELGKWSIGDRVLRSRLAGADREACRMAELARGTLPPDALGARKLEEILDAVDSLVEVAVRDPADQAEATSLDVEVTLPSGLTVAGSVPGVRGDLLHDVTYSRLRPAARLVAWTRLLALTASRPERPFTAITLGRAIQNGKGPTTSTSTIGPLGDRPDERRAHALGYLETLCDLYRRGMREPLPLYCKTSAAWVDGLNGARGASRDSIRERCAADTAAKAWNSNGEPPHEIPGEGADEEHELVFGGRLELAKLLEHLGAPRPDESGDEWDDRETTRLGRYAVRLWAPVHQWEEIESR